MDVERGLCCRVEVDLRVESFDHDLHVHPAILRVIGCVRVIRVGKELPHVHVVERWRVLDRRRQLRWAEEDDLVAIGWVRDVKSEAEELRVRVHREVGFEGSVAEFGIVHESESTRDQERRPAHVRLEPRGTRGVGEPVACVELRERPMVARQRDGDVLRPRARERRE